MKRYAGKDISDEDLASLLSLWEKDAGRVLKHAGKFADAFSEDIAAVREKLSARNLLGVKLGLGRILNMAASLSTNRGLGLRDAHFIKSIARSFLSEFVSAAGREMQQGQTPRQMFLRHKKRKEERLGHVRTRLHRACIRLHRMADLQRLMESFLV